MRKVFVYGIAASLLLSTYSCKKDKFDLPESQTTSEFYKNSTTFEAQFSGKVTSSNGTAIQGASISIGSSSYSSNDMGLFSIISNSGSSKGTIISVSASGYESTSIIVYPDASNPKIISNIALIAKDTDATFDANDGGTVSNQGVEIDFSKKSIVDASGNLYEGTVSVNVEYIDPSGSKSNAIPGGNLGLDENGNQKYLANHGTAMVKLTGENGEALNIKEGKTAEIKIPLGAMSTSITETSIPFWSYDEQNHYWIQEGFAEKDGNNMVANVRHFSYWSCSSPYDPINMTVNFVCNGNPQTGNVILSTSNGDFIGSQGTNGNGYLSALVPINTSMVLTCTEPFCDEVIYTSNIGPLTSNNSDLGEIEACSNVTSATFEGYLKDCNDQPLANGTVLILANNGGGVILNSDANGYYSGSMIDCGTTSIDVTAYDINNQLQSPTTTYAFQSINDFSFITVCSSLDEYFHYSLDGDAISEYDMDNGNTIMAIINSPQILLSCAISNDYQMSVSTNGSGIGTHPLTNGGINDMSFSNATSFYVTFTEYSETSGEHLVGTLSGTDLGNDGLSHTISGSFRIKVD